MHGPMNVKLEKQDFQ